MLMQFFLKKLLSFMPKYLNVFYWPNLLSKNDLGLVSLILFMKSLNSISWKYASLQIFLALFISS